SHRAGSAHQRAPARTGRDRRRRVDHPGRRRAARRRARRRPARARPTAQRLRPAGHGRARERARRPLRRGPAPRRRVDRAGEAPVCRRRCSVIAPTEQLRGLRTIVADDQAMVRSGFRLILEASGIEVVGEAGDGRTAVELARRTRPDVCILDIRMPVLDGLEATRLLAGPDVADPIPVVVVTTFDLDEYVHAALQNGASGFLLKDAGPALLIEAVRAAAVGDALVSPSVTVRLLKHFAPRPAKAPPQP